MLTNLVGLLSLLLFINVTLAHEHLGKRDTPYSYDQYRPLHKRQTFTVTEDTTTVYYSTTGTTVVVTIYDDDNSKPVETGYLPPTSASASASASNSNTNGAVVAFPTPTAGGIARGAPVVSTSTSTSTSLVTYYSTLTFVTIVAASSAAQAVTSYVTYTRASAVTKVASVVVTGSAASSASFGTASAFALISSATAPSSNSFDVTSSSTLGSSSVPGGTHYSNVSSVHSNTSTGNHSSVSTAVPAVNSTHSFIFNYAHTNFSRSDVSSSAHSSGSAYSAKNTTTMTPTKSTAAKASSNTSSKADGVLPKDILGYSFSGMEPFSAKGEGESVLNKYWTALYKDGKLSDSSCALSTPVVWAVAVALQSFVDGERVDKGKYTDKISAVYDFMDNYYNADKKGYSASQNKDNDLYYDDNAQVASALLTAYEATGDKRYLARGEDVVSFLMTGWNDQYGGVTWHLGQNYVASISTTETALACLRLYESSQHQKYLDFAEKSMVYVREHLWDNATNLIYDGATNGTVNKKMEFSYQVGTALAACVKLYTITSDARWKGWAGLLYKAGLDRNTVIYNRDYDSKYRWWRDELDFTQLLFDGLVIYYKHIDKRDDIKNEIAREARFVYDFAKGDDAMYFRSVNPLSNSDAIYTLWKDATGTTKPKSIDAAGFCNKKTSNAPDRKLITQAAAARIFLLTSMIQEKI